jgi:hypothetical protein
MTDQLTCVNDNARWDGVGTSCGQLLCCPKQYGDTDRDGDVDMDDFSALQRCLTIGQTGTNLVSAGCKCLDADANGKIDLDDVTHFSACASGEGIAANPGCWTRP